MTTVDTSKKQYSVGRKAASKLLKVSVRTVDRYVKDKKLSTRTIDGRVWLSKKEIKELADSKKRVDSVDMSTPNVSIDSRVDKVDSGMSTSQEIVNKITTRKRKNETKETYKILFNELQEELKEKQERLEIANYRVGQLEAQVRNSIPLLEYHQENFERKKQHEKLKKRIKKGDTVIQKLTNQIKIEKFNKRIFLFILLIIMALQPLWLILFYES